MIHQLLRCRFDILNASVKPLSAAGLYWKKVGKCAVPTVIAWWAWGETCTHVAAVLFYLEAAAAE